MSHPRFPVGLNRLNGLLDPTSYPGCETVSRKTLPFPHHNLIHDSCPQPDLCPNPSISPLRGWHAPHLWPPLLIFPGAHLPSGFGQLSKGTHSSLNPWK